MLTGFDMHGGHWYPDHARRNPTDDMLAKWREQLDADAPVYAAMGVEVVNASPTSSLSAYRKVEWSELSW